MPYPAEYVAARSVLLDALKALAAHLDNIILVGAQAVYLHTGDGQLAQPLMTTDADLALDTDNLSDVPEIAATLLEAGFICGGNPGHWLTGDGIAVDIMVVPHQSGRASPNARGARVGIHDRTTARVTRGLEPALVDSTTHSIGALDIHDVRRFDVQVAGPAALLVAKAIKIEERLGDAADGRNTRVKEKDALDNFRLLQAIDSDDLAAGFRRHRKDQHAGPMSERGLAVISAHGTSARSTLPQLAQQAASGDPTVAPSFVALANELLRAVD